MPPNLFLLVAALCCGLTFACTPTRPATAPAQIMYRQPTGDRMVILHYSHDSTYGYTQHNPIRVGGGFENGPARERLFIHALTGPKDEDVVYRRLMSCCRFEAGDGDIGFLDVYELTYPGPDSARILYLSMYDEGEVFVPVGFTCASAK
ncbi:MAG: hypothetical protein WA952_01515 [Lewinella sp.]